MSSDSQPEPQKKPDAAQKRANARSLLLSMADTTWRMFTPPAILVPAGIAADLKFGTKPWLTILSVPVGLALSVLLIKRQLEDTK